MLSILCTPDSQAEGPSETIDACISVDSEWYSAKHLLPLSIDFDTVALQIWPSTAHKISLCSVVLVLRGQIQSGYLWSARMSSTSVKSRSSHLHQSFCCSFFGDGIRSRNVGRSTHLNALVKVVEDSGSKQEILSSYDGVWQGQVNKERLQGCQGGRHRHAKSSQPFHTESTGFPFGDGVRDGVWDAGFSSRAGGNGEKGWNL